MLAQSLEGLVVFLLPFVAGVADLELLEVGAPHELVVGLEGAGAEPFKSPEGPPLEAVTL